MKLRKISTILLSSLAFVLALTLTSCGNGVANVTYVDENGTEQVQEIKKTENKDEVVDAMAAIAYSKSEEEFNHNSLGLKLNARCNISGTQNKKNYSEGLNASLDFRIGEVTKDNRKELNTYAKVSTNGQVCFEQLMNLIKNPKSITNTDESIDLTKTSKFDVSAEEYSDSTSAYFRINKLDGIPYSELGMSYYESYIKEFVGKLYYVDQKTISNLIPISLPSSLDGEDTSVDYSSLINNYSSMIPYSNLLTSYLDETITEYKERCKAQIEDANIIISSVNGSNITFKVQPSFEQETEENKYTGNSYIALTIDSKIKMPVGIDVDYGDYLTYISNNDKKENLTSTQKFGIKVSLNLNYNVSVPTLNEADKKKASDGSALISFVSMFIPRYK